MRDDRHFLGEAVDVVGFLLEEGQGDEQREVAILYACRLDARVHQLLDALPDAITPRTDDHAAAHAAFLGKIGLADHSLIPGREVLFARYGEGVLDVGQCLASGVWNEGSQRSLVAARKNTKVFAR